MSALHPLRQHLLGPIWLAVPPRARWRIVRLLNRTGRFCWADLAFAARAVPRNDSCDIYIPWPGCPYGCDDPSTGDCYCGNRETQR